MEFMPVVPNFPIIPIIWPKYHPEPIPESRIGLKSPNN